MSKKKKWIISAVGAFLIALWGANLTNLDFMPRIIQINVSPSEPLGLYLAIPGSVYRKGDFVFYDPPESAKDFHRKNGKTDEEVRRLVFLKEIGGLEGSVYEVQDNGIFIVDGEYRGMVKEENSKGIKLPSHKGVYTVKEGEFLPVANYSGSFDGRYTGTVPLDNIRGKAIPLFTE